MKFEIQKEVHKIHTHVKFRGRDFYRQTNNDKDSVEPITIKWFIGDISHELRYQDNPELWNKLEHKYNKAKNRK